MLDSKDSTITYTEVSSSFEDLSYIGSLGVVGSEYEGLSWMLDDLYVQVVLQTPPSPDYVPDSEEPEQAPPLPDFFLEPVYPKFMPLEDEVLPAKEQPLPAVASPTADSPGYVPESDSEEDPEEDPADYPANGGDDSDDEDESSDDDEDDYVDIEGMRRRRSTQLLLTLQLLLYQLLIMPHLLRRLSYEPPTSFWFEAEIARLLTIPSPLPSPLSLDAMIWERADAPSTSHPLPLPSPIVLPRTRASVAMLRAAAPSTYILVPRSEASPSRTPPLLPIPLPTPSPPLLPPSTDRKANVYEDCLPPQKRLCFAFGLGYEVGESSSTPTARTNGDFRRDYGFIVTRDDEIMRDPERDVSYGITDTWDEMLDTDEIYKRLDDAQTKRQMVTSRVNMLVRDRCAHARIARLIEIEARMSREAWGRSMDVSDLACTEIQLTEALKLIKTLQTQLTALQIRQGPIRGPAQPDAPDEAGSSS
ncbi:hypothetical protein Tco_1091205 [Tanacetum coccineum]|uniref:Uncharacterized protein n=1 Tax=Tanacetum coccineum TaxID=301880 RepID=A0ABQ5I6D2_9ASTR